MKKFNRTYAMGIFFLLFSAFVFWQTTLIPERLVSNEPGPKFFPFISVGGMVIMSILSMIFDGKKEVEKTKEGKDVYLDAAGWKRMAIILGEALLFCLAMQFIGFWITGILGTFLFVWTLKGDKKINIVFAVLLCVGLASLGYFGFTRGFNIPLPKGKIWEALNVPMP